MTTASELVQAANAVLLDFDGPVTALMPPPVNAQAADAARAALDGVDLPAEVTRTTDHLAVLRWTATNAPERLGAVEDACDTTELAAARVSEPTAGALEFLRWCRREGKSVVIVSNNAAEAITAYLNRLEATSLVRGIVGREPRRPDLLKPHPSLVLAALDLANAEPADAVLIGDAVTDIAAGHRAAVRVVGYGKSPVRAEELGAAGADAVVQSFGLLGRGTANSIQL